MITMPLGGPGGSGGIGSRRGKTGEKEIEERTITFNNDGTCIIYISNYVCMYTYTIMHTHTYM